MKKNPHWITVILFLFVITPMQSRESLLLIPFPEEAIRKEGVFQLSARTGITNQSTQENCRLLQDYLEKDFGINVHTRTGHTQIILRETPVDKLVSPDKEAYTLSISRDTVIIQASAPAGVFYGIQTLRQLIREDHTAPCLVIRDRPAYAWRAFMLDEARYFKGKQIVKELLDEMASLKMNIFHWHLTDDQGWRLEIKKYPLLTEIGAYRDSTLVGGWKSTVFDGIPHGGYYTQDDIREIVEYASQRHITIVPEIEMPGHATAAIASYSFLGVLKHPISVANTFGVKSSTFNVANEKVIAFLHDVLDEVFSLFPGKVVHIGGDEIHVAEWKSSSDVTAYMKKFHLRNYNDLQVFFTNNMSRFIASKGRQMMGWNDIMGKNIHEWSTESDSQSGTLSPDAIVHFWKGETQLIKDALEKGHSVVNSTHDFTYLDYDYQKLPLSMAYHFSPFPAGVDEKYRPQLLGLGCQMWCEWVPGSKELYRQVFPRIAAYAETGWTQNERKDFERFREAYKQINPLYP